MTKVTLQADWYPQPEHGGFYTALVKGYYFCTRRAEYVMIEGLGEVGPLRGGTGLETFRRLQ